MIFCSKVHLYSERTLCELTLALTSRDLCSKMFAKLFFKENFLTKGFQNKNRNFNSGNCVEEG